MKKTKIIKLFFVNLLLTGSLLFSKVAMSEQFSIVVIPDTQFYSLNNNRAQISAAQTQWVVENAGIADENIIYVAQLGDLTGTSSNWCGDAPEWDRVDAAMSNLDAIGIPYSVLPGNHDFDDNPGGPPPNICDFTSSDNYNGVTSGITGFGPGRFGFLGSNYGNLSGNNNNNFVKFSSPGGVDFIAINLAFSETNQPAVLNWADDILKQNPNHRAIITSHHIVNDVGAGACPGGAFGTLGGNIVSELVAEHPNIFMALNGHCFGERWITRAHVPGSPDSVRQCMANTELMLSNYQDYDNTNAGNNTGYMRIIRIDTTPPAGTDSVSIETFSPWIDGIPGSVDPHPTTATPSPTRVIATPVTTRADMDQDTIANFSFNHDFNTDLSPSVVVLLDVSGSMAWNVEGVPGVPASQQRIAFARQSALAFVDLISSTLDNPQKVQFGLVGFPDSTIPSSASAQVLEPLTWLTNDHRTDVMNTLNSISPSGGTPMLTGIEVAAQTLEPQLESCKSVVLLSDGYHNVPSPASVGSVEVDQLIDSINGPENQVPIYAISFGKSTTVDTNLLAHLATETGGEFYDATQADFDPALWSAATDLSATFKNIITTVFQEDIQPGVDPLDMIKLGEIKTFEMPINEHDTRASFFISWRTLQKNLITVRLFDSKDKQVLFNEAGVKIIEGEAYKIITVDNEALRAYPGRIGPKPWRVELEYEDFIIEGPFNSSDDIIEPIQYSVLLRSGLKFRAEVDSKSNATGDVITLTAKLTQGRRPIRGLKNISVKISAPSDSRGNWLSKNHVSAEQLRKIPSDFQGEFRPDHARKAIYLADVAGIDFPSQLQTKKLKLFDDGSHGDHKANDGIYTTKFHATKFEGLYSFHFTAKGKTLAGNHFTREAVVDKKLTTRAHRKSIVVKAHKKHKASKKYKKYTVKITPKDRAGNFLGPGHAGIIHLTSRHGTFKGSVHDLLNGSYSQPLRIPKSTLEKDVIIKIKVGEVVKSTTLARAIKNSKPPIED